MSQLLTYIGYNFRDKFLFRLLPSFSSSKNPTMVGTSTLSNAILVSFPDISFTTGCRIYKREVQYFHNYRENLFITGRWGSPKFCNWSKELHDDVLSERFTKKLDRVSFIISLNSFVIIHKNFMLLTLFWSDKPNFSQYLFPDFGTGCDSNQENIAYFCKKILCAYWKVQGAERNPHKKNFIHSSTNIIEVMANNL